MCGRLRTSDRPRVRLIIRGSNPCDLPMKRPSYSFGACPAMCDVT
jgi:hypothetical protein